MTVMLYCFVKELYFLGLRSTGVDLVAAFASSASIVSAVWSKKEKAFAPAEVFSSGTATFVVFDI